MPLVFVVGLVHVSTRIYEKELTDVEKINVLRSMILHQCEMAHHYLNELAKLC